MRIRNISLRVKKPSAGSVKIYFLTRIDNIISRTTDYQPQEDVITTRKSYYTYQKYILTVCESNRSFQEDFFSH